LKQKKQVLETGQQTFYLTSVFCVLKAAELQMLKKIKINENNNNNKINGKYWSSYVQWSNRLLLTP